MRFCLYTSTRGLDRFPELERFRVWRSTHKRLMQEDAEYRRSVSRFKASVLLLSVVYTIAVLSLAFIMVLSVASGGIGTILSVVSLAVLTVAYIVYTILVSFRMQEFMNESVGKALPEHAV